MRKAILVFFIALCLILCSCRTTETVVEYVPVAIDIEGMIQPILKMRPSDVVLIEDVQTLSDVMTNSVAFQEAYENWRAYALALEGFYKSIDTAQETD